MKKYAALFLFAAVFLLVEFPVSAAEAGAAEKVGEAEDALLREFGLEDVTDALEELMPGERIDFAETVRQIIGGELPFSWETAERLIKSQWMYQFGYHRESLVRILLLAVIAAVFANFSGIFPNQKIADVSFYVLYLLLLTVCLNGFRAMSDLAGGQLGRLTGFMKALGPVYFLAVAVAGRGGTSSAFYHLVLVLILLVELVIVKFVLPLIRVYMMVEVLNHLSEEDYLSKTAELVRLLVGWILKTMLACVVGFNVIQGLLMPVIDSVKRERSRGLPRRFRESEMPSGEWRRCFSERRCL